MKKRIIKKLVIRSGLSFWLKKIFWDDVPLVFLYHRFCQPGTNTPYRVDADTFRWQLEQISKRYRVMSFADCLEYFHQHQQWPKRTAVITIDDGYRDFYDVAYPLLKSLSIPATFFVTFNFVDQKIWLWPDRFDYALRQTSKTHFSLTLHQQKQDFNLNGPESVFPVWKRLSDYCIASTDAEKKRLITELETVLDIDVPEVPTADYAAVTWNELREMFNNGIEIGSHTMSHPILSKIPQDQLKYEIEDAKTELEAKLLKPVKTFCYPNGQPGDINGAVISAVKNSGYLGAPYWFDLLNWEPYAVPRIGVSTDMNDFVAKLVGFELLGFKIRAFRVKKAT